MIIRLPVFGEKWRHYKGSRYRIVRVGHDATNGNAVVIYESVESEVEARIWVRPLGEFVGYTDDHKPRFTYEAD